MSDNPDAMVPMGEGQELRRVDEVMADVDKLETELVDLKACMAA